MPGVEDDVGHNDDDTRRIKPMKNKFTQSILILVLLSWLSGCKAVQTPQMPTVVPNTANPASVYCEEQGGTLEIRDSAAGDVGACVFADGSECEEWAFFNGGWTHIKIFGGESLVLPPLIVL